MQKQKSTPVCNSWVSSKTVEKERKERNREGAEETGPLKKWLKSLGSMQPVAYFCESHLILLQEFLCRISGPNLWSLGTTRVLCLYLDESHKTHDRLRSWGRQQPLEWRVGWREWATLGPYQTFSERSLEWSCSSVKLSPCLGPSFFLYLEGRSQSSGSQITAVGIGMILNMFRGTTTSNNCFK